MVSSGTFLADHSAADDEKIFREEDTHCVVE